MGMGPRRMKCPADLYEVVAVVDLEAMQIFVKTMMGRKITMDVKADGSDTIDNIKEKIESKEEIQVTKQTLCFDGRILDNTWNLSFCGIQKEAILVLSEKGVIMHVRLTTAERHTILNDDTHDPMIVVMQKLQVTTGIPIARSALEVHEMRWPAALQPSVPLNRGA